jgi:MtN3 and saliva related transmembrane protein
MPSTIDMIGFLAGAITTLCWLPQAWQILRTRETAGVSLPSYVAFGAGVALWLTYGLMLDSLPIIIPNIVTLVLVLAIIGLRLRYPSKPSNPAQPSNPASEDNGHNP